MIDENLLPVERREEREFLYAVSYQPVRRLNELRRMTAIFISCVYCEEFTDCYIK